MHLLYDNEIRLLSIEAEKTVNLQRQLQGLNIFNKICKIEWVEETPEALALHTLKQSKVHFLQGDVERLIKAIAKNLSDKNWSDNQN